MALRRAKEEPESAEMSNIGTIEYEREKGFVVDLQLTSFATGLKSATTA